jgi:hypothetical protein
MNLFLVRPQPIEGREPLSVEALFAAELALVVRLGSIRWISFGRNLPILCQFYNNFQKMALK